MTSPPTKDGGEPGADAFDRAFDIEGADASAARLADDAALRAELDAARAAAAEEAERPHEESHAEYIDPKTVPPVSRVQPVMHSQKLYVNEAVAFPQKGIPTVRGMRPVLGPPSPEPPMIEGGSPKARSRVGLGIVIGAAAGALVLVGVAWLLVSEGGPPRPRDGAGSSATMPPTDAPPPSAPSDAPAAAVPTDSPAASLSASASASAPPSPSASTPSAEPPPSPSSSVSPATSSSAKPGRNPADYGGIQF